jgi:predicted DNA-binding WGR domain protein
VNADRNSNKFWEVYWVPGQGSIISRWGRNGTNGQSMPATTAKAYWCAFDGTWTADPVFSAATSRDTVRSLVRASQPVLLPFTLPPVVLRVVKRLQDALDGGDAVGPFTLAYRT